MTADEAIAKTLPPENGLIWYDRITWVPRSELNDFDRDKAYTHVFSALIEQGYIHGLKDPVIHHQGDGWYVVRERL